MLNRIIRLKAVLEIITNQTASALELLARQQTQMCATISQNHLALDYLLAEEGGICGKVNHLECCLQIDDDNRQAITNIATNITKIDHTPQTWDG
jgi:dihydroorotase